MTVLNAVFGDSSSTTRLRVRSGRRSYLQVNDDAAQTVLRDWHTRRSSAEKDISKFFQRHFGLNATDVPFYKVDQTGTVSHIHFPYVVPFLHEGWRGEGSGSNWLVPESATVRMALAQLPALPSRQEINEILNWPLPPDVPDPSLSVIGYNEFCKRASEMTQVHIDDTRVVLSVPFPDAFRDYAPYEQVLWDWKQPDIMSVTQRPPSKLMRPIRNAVHSIMHHTGVV